MHYIYSTIYARIYCIYVLSEHFMAKNQIHFNVSVYEPFGVSQSYYYFRRAVYEQCRLNFGSREKARSFHTISPRNSTSVRPSASRAYICIFYTVLAQHRHPTYYLNDNNSQTSRLKVNFNTPKDMYFFSLTLYLSFSPSICMFKEMSSTT